VKGNESDLTAFRERLEALRTEWHSEDERSKLSDVATMRLQEMYRDSNVDTRRLFDLVLIEWVVSRDSDRLFDATVLIREFRMSAALAAMRQELKAWKRRKLWTQFLPTRDPYAHSHALSAVSNLQSTLNDLIRVCGADDERVVSQGAAGPA
jgi:hypothetical protein